MNQNYYPIDFEAQYEDTSEKMIEITKKNQDRIKNSKPIPLEHLQQQLDDVQQRIEERELHFRKESIYSQFASGQLMAERRKNPPQMCPQCGEELKKIAQCEFCAELFCVKCCSRKRVIPFVSKDIRLCCEQCHWKFVKLFDNRQFYEEKQKLTNVANFVKNKLVKLNEKMAAKGAEVEEYKKSKRDEKIKEKATDAKIAQEQRRLRQIEEEFRKVVSEKAERMKEEERRRQREQEEREKARKAEEERERQEELQREREELEKQREEERQRLQKQKQLKSLEEQENLSASQKKIAEAQERDMMEILRRKEEELRRREEQLLKKEQDIRNQQQDDSSANSNSSRNRVETPKQSINSTSDPEKAIDTADSKSAARSRRQSDQLPKQEKIELPPPRPVENLVRTESTKSSTEQPIIKKSSEKEERKEEKKEEKEEEKLDEPASALERSLVNMFKLKKEDDAKSQYSSVSKNAKNILDMSINELLSVRLPPPTSAAIKVEKATDIEEEKTPMLAAVVEPVRPVIEEERPRGDRRSVRVQEVQEIKEEEVRMHKDSILRNSSLISSNKQTAVGEEETAPQKCACEIM